MTDSILNEGDMPCGLLGFVPRVHYTVPLLYHCSFFLHKLRNCPEKTAKLFCNDTVH